MNVATPVQTARLSLERIWTQQYGLELTDCPQGFAGLSREAYDALPGWNASLLKVALSKSPAHAWAAFLDPNREQQEEQAQFLIGNLFHCRLLEPELFDQRYITLPEDAPKRPTAKQLEEPAPTAKALAAWEDAKRRELLCLTDASVKKPTTKQLQAPKPTAKAITAWEEAKEREAWWKEFEQEIGQALAVAAKDLALGDALANAVIAHPVLGPRFADTPQNRAGNELTLTWIDSLTGSRCKARLDAVRFLGDRLWIGDLKSAMDAGPGPDHFGRAAANFNYCLSAAWYLDAAYFCRAPIEELLGLPEGALIMVGREFEFIAVEKTHPRHEFVGRYILTEEQAELGRRMARRSLELCVQAEASGWWPGYDSAAQPLELPPYAWKQMERLAGIA